MKKSIIIATLLLSVFILQSCQGETPNIVISKVIDATSMSNNAIELYNPTNEAIDLSQVELRIYNNGSTTQGGDHEIQLEGSLPPIPIMLLPGTTLLTQPFKTSPILSMIAICLIMAMMSLNFFITTKKWINSVFLVLILILR